MNDVYWHNSRGHWLPELGEGPHELTNDEMDDLTEREAHLYFVGLELRSYVPCAECRRLPIESKLEGLDGAHEFHDPCIAALPGVRAACCGHGVTQGYVAFDDGICLYGRSAHAAMRMLGGEPPECPDGDTDIEGVTLGVGWSTWSDDD